MKRLVLLAMLFHGAGYSLPEDSMPSLAAQEKAPKTDAENIALLGDDEYWVREPATQRLLKRGTACGVAVARASFDQCFEAQQRGEYILASHKESYRFPSDKVIASEIKVAVSNSRYWNGNSPILNVMDPSLDIDLTITSPHTVVGVLSPVSVPEGEADDGSTVTEQPWNKTMKPVCGTSVDAQCYLSWPGNAVKVVKVSAVLLLHVAPVEVLTFDDFEPKGGSIVFHENCTWVEGFSFKPPKDGIGEVTFRLFDLAGRLDDDIRVTMVDTEGVASTQTLKISGPTKFATGVTIRLLGSSMPKEIKLTLPPSTVREVRSKVQFEVSVPAKP